MLIVNQLQTYYAESQALFGIDFEVGSGEVVTLLGRNGMGKTTTLHSICGITEARSGQIQFQGQQLMREPAFKRARLGIAIVPEGRQIFPNLTVRENLVATARKQHGKTSQWEIDSVLAMFPALVERLDFMGNLLSGGEQQMLAIARALMTNPQLLLLDDATEGLAPLIRKDIWNCLKQIKAAGLSILIVDKNLNDLLGLADRHYVLEKGRIVWQGGSPELQSNSELQQRYLSL